MVGKTWLTADTQLHLKCVGLIWGHVVPASQIVASKLEVSVFVLPDCTQEKRGTDTAHQSFFITHIFHTEESPHVKISLLQRGSRVWSAKQSWCSWRGGWGTFPSECFLSLFSFGDNRTEGVFISKDISVWHPVRVFSPIKYSTHVSTDCFLFVSTSPVRFFWSWIRRWVPSH